MIFLIKCSLCFFIFCLIYLDKCESKVSIAIINLPVEKWEKGVRENILRNEYGDACIKVGVRKCFKALMQVRKKVCKMRSGCRSKFKSDFKKFSKISCINEFDYSRVKTNNTIKYIQRGNYRVGDAEKQDFVDTCIPHMVPQYKKSNDKSLRSDTLKNFIERILRSSSERRCERLARQKCFKACYYVRDEVCRRHSCSRLRKREFKEECKKKCKAEYIVQKTSSVSSSDSD